MATDIRVPTLGESVTEATIAQWFKKAGDQVNADEPLVELETDKVTVEVPAPASGILAEITIKEGETVEVGALLGTLEEGEGNARQAVEEKKVHARDEDLSQSSGQDDNKNSSSSGQGQIHEVVTPSAGESVTEAEVGTIYKKVGDRVEQDEALVELETDKATQEIPSPVAGTIVEIAVSEGDTVEVGALLMKVQEGDVSAKASSGKQSEKSASSAPSQPASSSMPPAPAAAKMMRENDMAAENIQGSGKRGQVLKGDVIRALDSGSATPSAPASQAAPRPASSGEDASREERVRKCPVCARPLQDV
jgi:2-oxoglutarate dehydrogenase E2 component (dihydrolipoamide succinyltransferase)